MVQPILPQADAYALARAMAGLEVNITPSPATAALLTAFDPKHPEQWQALQHILTAGGLMAQVLAVDPKCPPETVKPINLDAMPDLPKSARLTPADERIATEVGALLDDYTNWAAAAANQTPQLFIQAGGLFLGATLIGRRLHLAAPWEMDIYPNLYVMTIAVSTFYRKSTVPRLTQNMIRSVAPHMMISNPGSPEAFQMMLSGALPSNVESLKADVKLWLQQGQQFAAQRAIVRDEISGLFKSMARDYMAGLKELIMELYDAPDFKDHITQSKGLIIIRDAALSILGATTPAELGLSLSASDWYNGNMARFILLTPEPDYKERPRPTERTAPTALVSRFKNLYQSLPMPPMPDVMGNTEPSESWSLVAPIWDRVDAYQEALRQMCAPGSSLDDRLRSVYGRLHVQALKIAMILSAMDWSDKSKDPRPTVTPAHWARAHQITETWRASAHRLLADIGEREDERLERRLMQVLKSYKDGLTTRDIYRYLRCERDKAVKIIQALQADGVLEAVVPENPKSRKATLYKVVTNGDNGHM